MRQKFTKKLHPAQKAKKAKRTKELNEESGKLLNSDLLNKSQRKTIFKKHKARDVREQIAELKRQTKKLRKKDSSERAEKKRIAKQIKELKLLIKRSGEEASSSDSD